MSTQNLLLEWSQYETFTRNTVQNLLEDTDFSDVTLVCDDNRQIKAHKAILSACSPFFKTILKNNPHQHPLIYLRGVHYEDLQALVFFVYQGRAEVAQENLSRFLAISSEFQIEGIGDLGEEQETETGSVETELDPETETKLEVQVDVSNELVSEVAVEQVPTFSKFRKSQNSENGKLRCSYCDYLSNRKDNMQTHINSVHNDIRYPCNECEYKATQKSHLRRHKRNRHTNGI